MRNRVRVLPAALLAAALAITTGCGSDGGSADADASVSVLRIATATPVKTLNLSRTTEFPPMAIASMFAGTLTRLDPESNEPAPGLAKSFESSPDGLEYVFELQPGLKFSDGSALDSEDVVSTLEALRSDSSNVNVGDFASWDSVTAVDETTVEVKLAEPSPALPILMSAEWNAIYPAGALADEDFFEQPVSAGEYKLVDIASNGESLELEANEHFYGPEPAVSRVEFHTVPDENTRILQLKSGQLDVALELDPASIAQFDGDPEAAGEVFPLAGMYYIWMSNRDGPLADVNVRKAISAAVDRDQINDVVWAGENSPVGALLPPGVEGHEENISTTRDVDAAEDLLAGTACEGGCELGMIVRNGRPIDSKSALVIKENLKDIGIDVTIEPLENGVASERESSGDFDMEVEWLGLPIPDTSTYLKYAVVSDGGIEALFSGYKSDEMDDVATALATAVSDDERTDHLNTVNEVFARDLPYVPLQPWALVVGVRKEVRDLFSFSFAGYPEIAPK